ncbi:Lipase 2 precursor [Arthrobacter saudimassiliensis]|uniref:Lipase 2 n=1 Tax=Arthrobacter saudimassiliensis TaxID=1461584 RepID=A0A078MSJ3_9MICC|nr:Lipase 2 precursor [Arthrobacter saudimassiliensis]
MEEASGTGGSPQWRGARYVALGSSFASGPGLGPRAAGSVAQARRTTANYPHLLAERLGLRLVDATSSGAGTAHVMWARQHGQPPQADALTHDTRLVTVTVGGNDIGYATSMMLAGLPVRSVPLLRAAHLVRSAAAPATAARSLALLTASMLLVAQLLRRRAPLARILFVEYLAVVPPDPRMRVPVMSARQAARARLLAAALKQATEQAAATAGCELVGVADASGDHHAWSSEPWTSAALLPGGEDAPLPFHPNRAGMAAVAAMVEDHLSRPEPGRHSQSPAAAR